MAGFRWVRMLCEEARIQVILRQLVHRPMTKLAVSSRGFAMIEHRRHPRSVIKWPVVVMTPGGLVAENNHIHHYGRINRMYTPGIALYGVGNRAAHNLIHTAPHIGVMFGGNDHVIELNEIHHVCMESNDAGAVYAGRNWTMRGHNIRYNYFHHISGFEDRGCVGVYLDDMFASAAICTRWL